MAEQKKQNYLTGAVILAVTAMVTKGIGAIYKIPLFNLLGDGGTAHFQVIYNIYTLLLNISTAGVPLAISRIISSGRALEQHGQVRQTYRVALWLFGLIGLTGTLIMLLFAQPLATFMHDPEVALGIRLLSPAVLFACIVSVNRGYAQGHQNMTPTALSQVIEVMCKLVIGLAVAWGLSRAGYGLAVVAGGAIVGVTVGMGIGVPVTGWYRRRIAGQYPSGVSDPRDSGKSTAAQILKVSIPITLGASVISLINVIDSKQVLGRLQDGAGFSKTEAEVLYGVYSKGITLFHIPSSLITPVVLAVVPAIAAALAKKFMTEARSTMESCLRVTNLLAMPCAVGLAVLSEPIFAVLFPRSDPHGPQLLALLGAASYFVCCYSITNGLLQASGHERLALLSLPVGGVVKILTTYWLVGRPDLNITGAPVGTILCYVVITVMNLCFLRAKLPVMPRILRLTVRPLLCAAVMGATAWGAWGLLEKFVLPLLGGGRLALILCLAAAIAAAALVYFVLVIALRAVTKEDILLLPKGEKLAKLLKFS